MTATVDFGASLEEQCEQIWAATLEEERKLAEVKAMPPVIFLFDSYQRLTHLLLDVNKLHVEDIENDTGQIMVRIPFDHPVAQWIADQKARRARGEGDNVHVDVEKNGVRVSGRMLEKHVRRERGKRVLEVTFTTDYEDLKWVQCWSNPFLPAVFQFPRIFLLAGPSIWVLKTALFLNLLRLYSSLWQVPDDPLNPMSWLDGLDMSTWDIVIKPTTFLQDMAAGTTWCLFTSRWRTWHEAAKMILADCELSVVTRRWRAGDPEPWPGADIKDGAMVVDIVDKSGQLEGTANGGTAFDGLTRTAREFTADFLESTQELVTDSPPAVLFSDWLGTTKSHPAVHFPADMPGMADTDFASGPAKGVIMNTGGHSMPGVNEAISAGIQALGDIIGNQLQVGSIGGSVDTLLKPFYEDTVAAWMSAKLLSRLQHQGDSHLWEFFMDSGGKAYTLSSLMVLRTAVYVTKEWKSVTVDAHNTGPYVVGWAGTGHLYKGDRGSWEIAGDESGEIHVERAMKAILDWENGHFAQWELEFGTSTTDEDPLVGLMSEVEELKDATKELGVF
ncbi:hypothetical protein GYA93_15775 [Gordonia desulfuricans]|uniref:Gp28/Gp37-like domain-containing protein n=1 Tax=Gordonia desulfuricans TaxID=89051 RepID=A0A7K3LSP2_9ACTN|nr:hypothetical protein [Gordonia desulfuricans]NDK91031.1 hypothetical protein [Gordonia desulfuricans]